VSQHVDGPPQKFAWPYPSIGNWGPYTTAEGNKNYGVISMPNAWETLDGRMLYETFSHELGHNLGLCLQRAHQYCQRAVRQKNGV
jgi:hypothetical protein